MKKTVKKAYPHCRTAWNEKRTAQKRKERARSKAACPRHDEKVGLPNTCGRRNNPAENACHPSVIPRGSAERCNIAGEISSTQKIEQESTKIQTTCFVHLSV